MAKTNQSTAFTPKPKRKRPGIHSSSKSSKLKNSKNYFKKYNGQGR